MSAEDIAAGERLEAEGRAINACLKHADNLVAYILEHAQSEELSTHIEISFEPHHANMIANMAEHYRRLRAGEVTLASGAGARLIHDDFTGGPSA